MRQHGTIKSVKTARGFGFITRDEGGPDLFFHASALRDLPFDERLQERYVTFSVVTRDDGRERAVDVEAAR